MAMRRSLFAIWLILNPNPTCLVYSKMSVLQEHKRRRRQPLISLTAIGTFEVLAEDPSDNYRHKLNPYAKKRGCLRRKYVTAMKLP